MSNGEKITFYGLYDRVDFVEIPIIQRDYAQGRKDQSEVRDMFLDALYNALTVEQMNTANYALDLDFVYGSIEDNTFSVLDGQQRLTTLFLLHWFLAITNRHIDEFRNHFTVTSSKKSRFTYKTRPSSIEFFDALTSDTDFEKRFHQVTLTDSTPISALIMDSTWFYLSWKLDPTVQACLNMLDAIQNKFSNYEGDLYQRIINIETPFITFQFLRLESFGLTDELYIKMNARGKPLTAFEHFKAKLEQVIKSYKTGWPVYHLNIKGLNNQPVEGYKYFIHKIDTSWADLFWPYRNLASEDNTYDDELMNFIRLIILYQYMLDNQDSKKENLPLLVGNKSILLPTTLSQYENLNILNQRLIIKLISILDILHNPKTNQGITTYLSNNKYFDEESTFKKVLLNQTSYSEKLRFFAFYSYLMQNLSNLSIDKLIEWTRVIYNLTENTIVDSLDDFYRALSSVDSLISTNDSILDILVSPVEITGFLGDQVLEEKIKAHLLLKSDSWKDKILEAEADVFFRGQIGCLLNFSGILEYYRQHEFCDWNDLDNSRFLEKFSYYFETLKSAMNYRYPEQLDKRGSAKAINYLWERAVLTKGVYFTQRTQNRFNLLSSDYPGNNIERDHSWRRLLRISNNKDKSKRLTELKQDFVKQLIDDSRFEFKTLSAFELSLQTICDEAIKEHHYEEWRKYLIQYPELYTYCDQGFIQIDNQIVFLLWQSQRNHYHSELYTVVLKLQLEDVIEKITPFSNLEIQSVKSSHERAYLKISGWSYESNDYYFKVFRQPNSFTVKFQNNLLDNYPQEIIEVIENHGLACVSQIDEELNLKAIYYETSSLNSLKDVQNLLIQISFSLKDL